MRLGCIADDFTGATDLANNLVRAGMRVMQTIGIPEGPVPQDVDAVVVALKSRTIAAAHAVSESLAACRWLKAAGATQIYYKVCSTFDSTDEGNIGPVTEALMAEMGADFVPVCPAFPENQRTLFNGHLFVGQVLLSESSMRNHPLTPMQDANLVRVMQRQCTQAVGLIDHRAVQAGAAAILERMTLLRKNGKRLAIVDAVSDEDLMSMGRAFSGLPLLVAGSGVALGLPQNFDLSPGANSATLPAACGAQAIVSGSCSAASNEQVALFKSLGGAAFAIDPLRASSDDNLVAEALTWAEPLLKHGPVLVYATAEPDSVQAVQTKLGVQAAGALTERVLSDVAHGLVGMGVQQLIVAGGETSGACVKRLGIKQLRIGVQIDPGVPWCHAADGAAGVKGIHIALKSGNFGSPDFFLKGFRVLQ